MTPGSASSRCRRPAPPAQYGTSVLGQVLENVQFVAAPHRRSMKGGPHSAAGCSRTDDSTPSLTAHQSTTAGSTSLGSVRLALGLDEPSLVERSNPPLIHDDVEVAWVVDASANEATEFRSLLEGVARAPLRARPPRFLRNQEVEVRMPRWKWCDVGSRSVRPPHLVLSARPLTPHQRIPTVTGVHALRSVSRSGRDQP